MAGLVAAYELEKLGHTVRIIEGNDRVGGRVLTHRFADGTYHELGAMRLPRSHEYARHYVNELGLKLRKFVSSPEDEADAFFDIRGIQTRIKDAKANLYPHFALTPEEAALPDISLLLLLSLEETLNGLTDEEIASLFTTELASDRLRALDQTSLGQYLGAHASPAAMELLGSTTGLSAEYDRSVTFFLRAVVRRVWEGLEEVVGGMDQLPQGLAQRIQGPIELRTRVLGVRNREDGQVELTLSREGGRPVVEVHDQVLVTLPFSVLRDLDTPTFSAAKNRAIRDMGYGSATKVLVDSRRRFWESDEQIFGGSSQSDRITGATHYPSDNAEAQRQEVSAGPGALVASYASGAGALELAAMEPEERVRAVTKLVSRFHPQLSEPGMIKDWATVSWDRNPWSRGAFAVPLPGEHALQAVGIRPEGSVHFAGEHLSPDQSWIQGAVESSLRAVEEIVTSAPARRLQGPEFAGDFKLDPAPSGAETFGHPVVRAKHLPPGERYR